MDERLAIKVENLSKVYQLRQPRVNEEGKLVTEHWALKEVSFEIKKGESVGIIGPNGSGKSTLLKILAGVTKPSSGSVQIRGKVASILDIGAGFHPELSGRENVFLNGQLLGFKKNEIKLNINKIIDYSGIGEFIDEPVKNYSNGMYLRLAFSIMVHLDFDIYLFDEVMSVGDAAFRAKSMHEIKQMILGGEKSILLISHTISEVASICKTVLVAQEGRYSGPLTLNTALKTYGLSEKRTVELPAFVQTLDVSILPEKHLVGEDILNDEAISIVIKHTFKSNEEVYALGIRVKDQLDHVVFNSSPLITKEGIVELDFFNKHSFVFEIPPLFFNAGIFFIDIIYFRDNEIIEELIRFVTFSVALNPIFNGDSLLGQHGPVKPVYNWTVE